MKLYFSIGHTQEETKVQNILFFGGKEASKRWKTLQEQVKKPEDPEEEFATFANSLKKSSLHWESRYEYLGDIKQVHEQTTTELDIYIKDLIRRCQFTKRSCSHVRSCYCSLRLESLYKMPNLRSLIL